MKIRRRSLKPVKPKVLGGWLARYAQMVGSASTGAVMKRPQAEA
jgi:hypothetical protein